MKKILASVFGLMLLIFSFPASAVLKIDVGGSAAEITKTISGYVETAKKKMDESVALQTAIAYGKGAAEAGKQLQQMKNDVEQKVNAIKEDPLGSGLDVVGDLADKTGLSDNEKLQQAVNKVNEKAEDAKKLADLEEQKKKLTDELNQKLEAEQKTAQAKIDALEKNNASLDEMIKKNPDKAEEYKKQQSQNDKEIKALKTKLELASTEISEAGLAGLADVGSQISGLQDKAAAAAQSAKDKAKQALLRKLAETDNKSALSETVDKNYLAEGEVENSANTARVKTYRKYVAVQDMLDVFAKTALTKQSLDEKNTEAEQISERTGALDGSSASVAMATQVEIKNILGMARYIETMLLDLKMRTSEDLSDISSVKQSEQPSDIASFNLDNYIYEPGGK